MRSQIRALLFDADGVVQRQSDGGRAALASLLQVDSKSVVVDDLMRDIFAAERPALSGEHDFIESVMPVLTQWNLERSLDQLLRAWTNIQVVPEVIEVIQELRAKGLVCCLATNQQSHRANYMSQELGYRNLFDREYYSCRLGCGKPDAAYFQHILQDLELEAEAAIFLDDNEANVEAASAIGLNAALYHCSEGKEALISALRALGVAYP